MLDSSSRLRNRAGMGRVTVTYSRLSVLLMLNCCLASETGTSAGLKRPLSPDVSERGLPNKRYTVTEPKSRMRPELRRRVYNWVNSVAPPSATPLPRERSPTPALSDVSWSSSSDSTVVDHDMNGRYYGDWLILPSTEE